MKLALFSSITPFVRADARELAERTEIVLRDLGHEVDRVDLPFAQRPDLAVRQMAAYRWIDSSAADRIICFQPPAHLIPHSTKVIWFTHHIRTCDGQDGALDGSLRTIDRAAMEEAHAVYAGSQTLADRLLETTGVRSEVLAPPPADADHSSWAQVIERLLR